MLNENAVLPDREKGEEPDKHADLIAALLVRPHSRAWDSVRAAWLFQTADALDLAGYNADAIGARKQALVLVRSAISIVARSE